MIRYTRQLLVTGMMLSLLLGNVLGVEAKKKDAKGGAGNTDKAVEKVLKPVTEEMDKLLLKVNGRYLFSPDDAKKVLEIKYQLIDLIGQYPSSQLVVKPVYQFGILLSQREQYDDAYELLYFLASGFPQNVYGMRAKRELQQIKKHSSHFFSEEIEKPATPPEAVTAKKDMPVTGKTTPR